MNLNQFGHYYIASSQTEKLSKLEKWLKKLPNFTNAVIFVGCKEQLNIVKTFLEESEDNHRKIKQNVENDENLLNIVVRRGGGDDVETSVKIVDVVFNYDEPKDAETYKRRVAHAGSLRTDGLVITFVSNE